MTTRERVLAALNHEEADRVPMWTLIDNSAVMRHFAPEGFDFSFIDDDYEDRVDTVAMLTGRACRGLGIDVTFLCDWFVVDPFPHETRVAKSGSDHRTEFTSVDDVINYQPTMDSYDEFAARLLPRFRRAQEMVGPDVELVSQGGACIDGLRGLLGLEMLSLAMYDAPTHVSRILEVYAEGQRIKAQVYADNKLSFAYQVSCDIAYKGSLMYSPDFLRREVLPRFRREIEPVKEAGIKVVFHSDGDVTEILDDLVDAGIDALNPVEPTAGMDLGALKKRYGKNLAYVGNVDSNTLTHGTLSEVVEDTKRCLRDAAKGGGLLVDSGSGEIYPDFPVENVIAMCDAVREFGRYPIALD